MSGINMQRVLLGGILAGLVTFVLEGLAGQFYMESMTAAMQAHNLSMEMSPRMFILALLVSLIGGIVLIFLYAAVRPRFGPGPKTAVLVACVLWVGGYLLSLIGYEMMGLFPRSLLMTWGAVGLVEMILAALLGAWIYKED